MVIHHLRPSLNTVINVSFPSQVINVLRSHSLPLHSLPHTNTHTLRPPPLSPSLRSSPSLLVAFLLFSPPLSAFALATNQLLFLSLPLPHRVPSAGRSCETPRAPHYARMSLQQVLRTIKRNGDMTAPKSLARGRPRQPRQHATCARWMVNRERARERRLLLSWVKAEVDSISKTCISETCSAQCPVDKTRS